MSLTSIESISRVRARLVLALGLGVLAGALVAVLLPFGSFGRSFFTSAFLITLGFYALMTSWRWLDTHRWVLVLAVIAFLLRLAVGIGLELALPLYGYDSEPQKAGYIFFDAYRRDGQAWELAQSDHSLLKSFGDEFYTDQYGGLLALSGLVYRVLSPDAHRPYLIVILAAFATAFSLPFLHSAVERRWGRRVAAWTTAIYAFYPESVLLGASQMREPFLIGIVAMAFFCVLEWRRLQNAPELVQADQPVFPGLRALRNRRLALLGGMALLLFAAALISWPAAISLAVAISGWFWLDVLLPHWNLRQQRLGWLILLSVALVVAVLTAYWLRTSAGFDLNVTVFNSGFVQKETQTLDDRLRILFVVVYGLFQPVLPAALTDNALPLWKGIVILRSLGWYALAPLLLYGWVRVFRAERGERRLWWWLALFSTLWILVSALRGGGDQWDNPRYRVIFLPWLALWAAWALDQAWRKRDIWLATIVLMELIFLGFFMHWYLSRYLRLWHKMPFWRMTAWIVGLSLLVLGGSVLWEWLRKRAAKRLK